MILPLPGIYVKEELSGNDVLYLSFEYNCEEVERMYKNGRYDELFIMKNGLAVENLAAFTLKDAVGYIRRYLGLKDGRSCRR